MHTHKAIPCCPQGSVSTWTLSTSSTGSSKKSRVVIPVFLLIRWVKSIVSGIWQRQLLFAWTARRLQSEQVRTKKGALPAAEKTISRNAKIDGTELTRNVGTISLDQIIIAGEAEDLRTTTSVSPKKHTAISANSAENRRCWSTTKTAIGPTTNPRIFKFCASGAIRYVCTSANGTFLSSVTLQRYSQYPRKLGINTLNYGEGPKKLAHTLGVSVEDAKGLIEKYFAPYPKVRDFIRGTHRMIKFPPYGVETILGRPRRFEQHMRTLSQIHYSELTGEERMTLAQCERQSVNSVIQGSAADVARMAMILCDKDDRLKNLGADMLLQIHDELIFEVPEENLEEAKPIIREIMEYPLGYDLAVPLGVDMGSGYSWASAKG